MKESVPRTRRARINQQLVILSGVVVRKADDNAVEGPRVRSRYQQPFEGISIVLIVRSLKPSYSTVTDLARFLG
jgi:hypothetical protein